MELKRNKKITDLLGLVVLLIIGLAVLFLYKLNENRHMLYISHESGIYKESFELELKALAKGTIYYTSDGSIPRAGAASTQVYEGPLPVTLANETTTCSYQFYCVFEDGEQTDVFRRDFVLDERGESRFTTKYIVSITGDEESLFGYEEGLFVRGRQFDEYMEANPNADTLSETIPANYLSDAQIGVHAAVFLPDGTQVINQNCGLKIYGNITRAKNQKSFRLIARTDYDVVNEFSYPLLPKLLTEEGQVAVDAFQRLSFHNAGNDNGYAFIRTELIGELARRTGFPDVLVAESAVVFVNGRYQGVYWLNNTYDDRYFEEKYGEHAGEFIVCEGTVSTMDEANAKTPQEQQCVEEYNTFCKWAETADLTREENWKRVTDTIDVENFAKYMAIEYYVSNIDWPHNNVKVYRYQGVPGETYTQGTVFDGRYRYLLYDTDYGMGLQFMGWFGNNAEDPMLDDLCNSNEYTGLFQGLLQREEFRNLFINEVLTLMNTAFARPSVETVLGELNAGRYEELRYMLEETDLMKDSLWESDDNGIANVDYELATILNFADYRPATVATEMQEQWDCGGFATVELDVSSVQGMQINGAAVEANNQAGTFVGTYFEKIPLKINCETAPGIIIDGYMVAGQYLEGSEITVTPGDWVQSGETLQIQVISHTEDIESLEIARYRIRGTQDYVVIRNNGRVPVLLSEYTVADTFDDMSKGQLPYLYLAPGEEFTVYGKEYSGEMTDSSYQATYGWAVDEPVLLVHSTKGIVDAHNLRFTQNSLTGA